MVIDRYLIKYFILIIWCIYRREIVFGLLNINWNIIGWFVILKLILIFLLFSVKKYVRYVVF